MSRNRDLIFILLLNFLLIPLIALSEQYPGGVLGGVRVIAGVAYILFAPGYALQAALLPWRSQFPMLDRLMFSLGLSIAVMPFLGLILDGPLGGIFLTQSLVFLTTFTFVFSMIAIMRRSRVKDSDDDQSQTESLSEWWQRQSSARKFFAIAVIAGVLLGSALAIGVLITPDPDQYLTEFYMLGPDNAAILYPEQVDAGKPFSVRVGVANQEKSAVEYQIEVFVDDVYYSSTAPFTLEMGDSIQTDLVITINASGSHDMRLNLLRGGQIYRHLLLKTEAR